MVKEKRNIENRRKRKARKTMVLTLQFLAIMATLILLTGGLESLLFGTVDGTDIPNNPGIVQDYFE